MRILVTGATGLIGTALVSSLKKNDEQVARLTRSRKSDQADILWDPASGAIDPKALEGFDAVVHLAGDPIVKGRWTPAKKARIRDSRVNGTRLLAQTLAGLHRPPQTLVCASAIGIYGNRGEEILTEESLAGTGFLAEVGRAWEEAAQPATRQEIRVVNLRFGIVLSPKGGALKLMLVPFRLGLGGRLGSGKQYMSWVALEDVVGVIRHALNTQTLRGPVNTVSPNPVTNLEFTKTLGRVLHRPALFPVPAFGVRILFGEMGNETLLASTRVHPGRLLASGYKFIHPQLEEALRSMLNG